MGKIIITINYEIETEHNHEDIHVVKAIANSIAEGGEQNVDDQTTFEVKGLTWTKMVPTPEDLMNIPEEPVLAENAEHVNQ